MTQHHNDPPGGTTITPLRESASHEAGHVLLCLVTPSADLAFARAATGGRGTSRLINPMEQEPGVAAQIAVAGRVSEEVLLGLRPRPVPNNDGFLLTWALDQLEGVSEDEIRRQVREQFEAHRPLLAAITDLLHDHADEDVTWESFVALAHEHGVPV